MYSDGYFARTGEYTLIDPTKPIYGHNDGTGCQIAKMDGIESCGTNNCDSICSNGPCYKVFK